MSPRREQFGGSMQVLYSLAAIFCLFSVQKTGNRFAGDKKSARDPCVKLSAQDLHLTSPSGIRGQNPLRHGPGSGIGLASVVGAAA